ncbi:ComF family protein [Leucobacter viscericola]|uniref:ComF family protein n=1 Tax=Leucobacter viscericola TaxID=2714935 RepID=A0A6G7XEP5_9MICO|nr:phosphoribosyltransferase family protein [Leucobacter viscericola]QIK62982.1 ComF family protein [Leucobacter viscericola]
MRGRPSPRPRVLRALRTLRGRTSQVGLKLAQREKNAARIRVRGSARPRLRDREIVLVDDVITTGATARAAQKVLEEAGARVIAVVALCAVVRRDTRQNSGTGNALLEGSRLPERRKVAPHRPTA